MVEASLPQWAARAFPDWVGNVIMQIAPNRVRKLYPMPEGISSNFAQFCFINDKAEKQVATIALMEDVPGYEKYGLEIGLDFQPYLIWARIGFNPFPPVKEPQDDPQGSPEASQETPNGLIADTAEGAARAG